MKEKVIIGFDQALANTGYAIWSLNQQKIIKYGVIRTSSKNDLIERLQIIKTSVKEIIKEAEVKEVYLEEVFCPRSTGTAWPLLLCVEATIKLYLLENKIEYKTIASKGKKSWRAVLGIGTAKTDMKEKVKEFTKNEHIADAVGILIAGLNLHTEYKLNIDTVNYQKIGGKNV